MTPTGTIIVSLLMVLSVSAADPDQSTYTINHFKRSYFKIISQNEGFYRVADKLEESPDELPVAFGFVDPDFFGDVATVSADMKRVSLYLFHEDDGQFTKIVTSDPFPGDERVRAVRLAYLTSRTDSPNLLVLTESRQLKKAYLHAFRINRSDKLEFSLEELKGVLVTMDAEERSVEPVNFQISNDGEVRDFWLVWVDGKRQVLSYDRTSAEPKVTSTAFSAFLQKDCPGCQDFDRVVGNKLAAVGSHRVADLNGNGMVDLVLESLDKEGQRVLEFYELQASGKFGLLKTVGLSADYSLGSFVDLRDSGRMDLVFWNKKDRKLEIHLAEGLTTDQGTAGAEGAFGYSLPSLEGRSTGRLVLDILPGSQIQDEPDLLAYPILQFADLSLKGVMDLVINTVDPDGGERVHVFPFNDCFLATPPCAVYQKEYDDKTIGVVKSKRVLSSSLFDFGERG